jgi:hypothetical protein
MRIALIAIPIHYIYCRDVPSGYQGFPIGHALAHAGRSYNTVPPIMLNLYAQFYSQSIAACNFWSLPDNGKLLVSVKAGAFEFFSRSAWKSIFPKWRQHTKSPTRARILFFSSLVLSLGCGGHSVGCSNPGNLQNSVIESNRCSGWEHSLDDRS